MADLCRGVNPDAYLNSLEPVGWRFGLERMRKLTTALGMPQHRFASIHVVGTNGKSSVTRMTAPLLEAHGVSAGACVSPHTECWSQRTLVHGEEVAQEAWAQAVEQVARAAEGVNRTLEEGEAVTQFEAATAASFVALANARVRAGVIEAGLGGRLDATNTIPSKVTVLTSIGLDHTEWLGETEVEIATEKLAVLRDQTTLVLGEVSDEVRELAEATARERNARLVPAPPEPQFEVHLRAPGEFQRRNFAIACTAAEAFLGRFDPELAKEVAATITVPGRLEMVADDPPTYIDAAHNPAGAMALARSLLRMDIELPVTACLAVLTDKDAPAMVRALEPALDYVICTELPAAALEGHGRPGARSRPAADLEGICREVGLPAAAEPDFEAAVRRARANAEGTVVIAGSHYAVAPARAVLAA